MGLLISLWCVSGFVMMYVQYPSVSIDEELAALPALDLQACCVWPEDFSNIEVDSFRVEMLNDRPVIRLVSGFGEYTLDLRRGLYREAFDIDEARAAAAGIAARRGDARPPRFVGAVERDQWTVGGGFDVHRPLFLFEFGDEARTRLYLSSYSGAAVQQSTAVERFWNWPGAVTHWIYPTVLRRHAYAWSQVIIWTSIAGLLLTVVGLFIGIKQFKSRRNGRYSPYRGVWLWHHYAGLVFGVLTLTWLFSGLLSVQPWGVFESRSFAAEADRLRGRGLMLDEIKASLHRGEVLALPAGTVRLEGAHFAGRLYTLAWRADASSLRLDGRTFEPAPLTAAVLERSASSLRPEAPILDQGWLEREDAYYYDHHVKRRYPVYRIRYADGERLYLDGTSGQLALTVDNPGRSARWLFLALHRGDFAALVRERPVWDLMMWVLMSGVTLGALTGAWLGGRRVVHAIQRMTRRLPNGRATPPTEAAARN